MTNELFKLRKAVITAASDVAECAADAARAKLLADQAQAALNERKIVHTSALDALIEAIELSRGAS